MSRFDPRAFRILRIGTAALVLTDLALRARDLAAHYSDAGVLPRALFSDAASPAFYRFPWSHLSPFLLHGAAAYVATVGALLGVAAGLLGAGWRTRITGPACWFLLVSLHARNAWLLDGGDALLRLILFWGCFLGRDGWAGFAYLLQISLLYFFAGYHKHGWGADTLRTVLSLQDFARPWTRHLLELPRLLAVAAPLVRAAEMILPFVLLFGHARARRFAVALLVGFHVLLALLLDLGIFPFVCLVALAGVLPYAKPRGRPSVTLVALMALAVIANFDVTPARRLAGVLWLEQEWRLFDVVPPADVRFTLEADGRRLVAGWETRNVRWRNYLLRLAEFGGPREYAALASYFCRASHTVAHDARLVATAGPERREVWRGDCQSFAR